MRRSVKPRPRAKEHGVEAGGQPAAAPGLTEVLTSAGPQPASPPRGSGCRPRGVAGLGQGGRSRRLGRSRILQTARPGSRRSGTRLRATRPAARRARDAGFSGCVAEGGGKSRSGGETADALEAEGVLNIGPRAGIAFVRPGRELTSSSSAFWPRPPKDRPLSALQRRTRSGGVGRGAGARRRSRQARGDGGAAPRQPVESGATSPTARCRRTYTLLRVARLDRRIPRRGR